MTFVRTLLFTLCLGLVTACGEPAKQDIIKDAENATTKAALEQALGEPNDVSKFGPLEKWTYKASDGSVVFVITGDSVSLQATGDK